MNYQELSLLFMGSGVSLLISAVLKETTAMRYGVGGLMLMSAVILAYIA